MTLDNELLEKLEKLSSFKIDGSKREDILKELSTIVDFVENLNELNLDNEKASFTTLEGGTPFREDIPKKDSSTIKMVLANAPKQEDGFFVVPKIIE